MVTASLAIPLPDLLQVATRAGATFRLAGAQIRVTAPPDPVLAPTLVALRSRRNELWSLLGGTEADAPSLAVLTQLEVQPVVPATTEEALALIAEMEADADIYTPADIREARGGVLGLDLETAANPGEDSRPAVKLRLRDGLLAKQQPALKGDAGLDPHRSRARLAQLYGGGRRCLVLDTTTVPIDLLDGVLGRRVTLIHNAAFDLGFLAEAGLEVPRFEDVMQAAGLLLGAHRRGLDDAADAYLGLTLPKNLQRSDWSAPILSPGQLAYAALDAIVVFRLWPKLRTELREKQRGAAYILQRDVTPATVRMTRRGITLDRTVHRQQISEWQTALVDAQRTFTKEAGQDPPETPNETRAFLCKALPVEIIAAWPRTGKQQVLSTKTAELKRHIDVPPIRSLLAITATTKLLNSFGEELARKVSPRTARLHPTYNIAGTKTGRFSSSNPNIQQIPKHKAQAMRGSFVAAPGMKLVLADYSAMELRAAGAVSDDHAMNADFAAGIDLHRRQAAEMLGIPQEDVTVAQRDHAKPICFGTIYGAGARGLAASAWGNYGIVMSLAETEEARRAFLARYPRFGSWMDSNFARSNRLGFITIGRLGRVIEASWEHHQRGDNGKYNWRFLDEEDDDFDDEPARRPPVPWQAVLKRTLCCNAPVQGACADAAMRALILVDAALSAAGIEGGPVLFVHDEIVAEVPEADAERARTIVVEAMTRAFAETFPDAPLNGVVESKIATAWGPRKAHDAPVEATAGDASRPDLSAREVPCPADGGATAASPDQGGRAAGRDLSAHERVDVPTADTDLMGQEPEDKGKPGKSKSELAASLLARVCDRCGASPCKVFGATTTFCTLECWQAPYAAP